MIIAVSTEAMILFHSKDDIDTPCPAAGRSTPPTDGSIANITLPVIRLTGHLVAAELPARAVVTPKNPIILIPARLGARRLPGKPLAEIAGTPMIVHVWRRAVAAGIGPVVVACGDLAIAEVVEAAGGRAVMTDPDQPTGSDRIHEAIMRLDPGRGHDAVINVQGDLPMLDPAAVRVAVAGLADPETDIATLAAVIEDEAALQDISVNKVVAGFADPARPARALYFSKAIVPWGPGPHYEHIGLYAYRRAALERFVRLARGVLEEREHLEQLRALEAGMRISVSLIEASRLGVQVDTPSDLARARQLLEIHPVIPTQAGTQGRQSTTASPLFKPGAGSGPPLSR
jgi:3-deoxy-manno-octulosonate cytidylyltransferase (CMP-KDO synthetase)